MGHGFELQEHHVARLDILTQKAEERMTGLNSESQPLKCLKFSLSVPLPLGDTFRNEATLDNI